MLSELVSFVFLFSMHSSVLSLCYLHYFIISFLTSMPSLRDKLFHRKGKVPEPSNTRTKSDFHGATLPRVNAVYYPNWRAYRQQPPSSLSLSFITHIYYAFVWYVLVGPPLLVPSNFGAGFNQMALSMYEASGDGTYIAHVW